MLSINNKIDCKSFIIDKEELPKNSGCDIWKLRYARFTPFNILQENVELGNQQLNWTNMFLWKMFGSNIDIKDHNELNEIKLLINENKENIEAIKKRGCNLTEQLKRIKIQIEELSNDKDVEKLNETIDNELNKSRIGEMENTIKNLEKEIKDLKQKLGFQESTSALTSSNIKI